MQKIIPCLWFNGQAEEAARLYTSLFQGGEITAVSRYPENTPGPAGEVMLVDFRLAGSTFAALNGGPEFSFSPAISFYVGCPNWAEVDALWQGLSQGAQVLMPLDAYPFSERFGWLVDRFGVSWQISQEGTAQSVCPYFLFVGTHHGMAEAAIGRYTALFEESAVDAMDRHGPGEGETEGTVRHARFRLAGQPFIAMDSALPHPFGFTSAISFIVNCFTQAEIDHFYDNLLEGGEEQMCGWLVDRYGVTWQIVPEMLDRLMTDPDREKANRVTQAMLQMKKLDIAALQKAYAG